MLDFKIYIARLDRIEIKFDYFEDFSALFVLNSALDIAQLLWLEMALFSKKALHNIEKHS